MVLEFINYFWIIFDQNEISLYYLWEGVLSIYDQFIRTWKIFP
jgi:hypothetical protein